MRRLVLAAALAALSPAARAESDRWGSFHLAAGSYRPDIDADFVERPGPYETVFGTNRGWMFRVGISKALYTGFGSLEAGVQVGYFQDSGKGQLLAGGASGDDTRLRIVPTSVGVTYRFDLLADRYDIPLAPYARASLERYNWWVTDGGGSTSKNGATNGWSVAGGLALLLDFFDPGLARELDHDTGVNGTYLFVEATQSVVDDFGDSSSWDLSDEKVGISGGLLFVF